MTDGADGDGEGALESEDFGTDETVLLSEELPPTTPMGPGETGEGATSPSRSGRLADRYQILGLLGRGGMGNVYRVRDEELDEIVALKMLHHELAQQDAAIDRFRAEVRLARRVTHRNVARTFDIGTAEGQPFLTMEFVEGDPLDVVMKDRGQLEVGAIIEIAVAVCDGLAAAHEAGVVHQDLKPPNVMIDSEGRVVISDFGIARARDATTTQAGGLAGTPAYMAPEQVRGVEQLDGRVDIYALGVMLFEMLSGQLPFLGPTPLATALARMLEAVPTLPPEVPQPLAEVVQRCMARDRDARFAEVSDVRAALLTAKRQLATGEHAVLPAREVQQEDGRRNKRVAILPLKLRGSAEFAHLSDGITEELIDELSMASGLRVKPRTAVTRFDQDIDPIEAGRLLGVEVVIEGSFRIDSERLRVRLAALSVEDGFQLWSQRFDGSPGDVFEVCGEAVEAIAQALTVEPAESPRADLTDAVTIDLYMRARKSMWSHWHSDLEAARDSWEKVLARAPDDPRVLAGAATFFGRLSMKHDSDQGKIRKRAARYAGRAIEAAPEWPEPYIARAVLAWNQFQLGAALSDARRALEFAPGYVDAHTLVGKILLELGPIEEAVRHFESALEIDPNHYSARWELTRARALQGRWQDVDTLLSLGVDEASHRFLRQAVRSRTDLWRPEPRWIDEPLPDITGDYELAFYIYAVQTVLDTGEMPEDYDMLIGLAHELAEEYPRVAAVAYQHACEMACYVDDLDNAKRMLHSAVDSGLLDIVWFDNCQLLDVFRDEGWFGDLRERVAENAGRARRTEPAHQLA